MHELVLHRLRERHDQHLAFRVVPEVGAETADEDAGVGADGGFGVRLETGEVAEEVVVEDALGELRGG